MAVDLKRGTAVPEIGTEFRVGDDTYVVTSADRRRFLARPKRDWEAVYSKRAVIREMAGGKKLVSIFDPDDWLDEYSDGRQFLDPEPEDWGWRNGK